MLNLRTCRKCGWVHFSVSKKFAETEVAAFNAWLSTQPDSIKEQYPSRGAELSDYAFCDRCGQHWTGFCESLPGDCPDGVTIGPIIFEEDEE